MIAVYLFNLWFVVMLLRVVLYQSRYTVAAVNYLSREHYFKYAMYYVYVYR